jgi:hypothetical protein
MNRLPRPSTSSAASVTTVETADSVGSMDSDAER